MSTVIVAALVMGGVGVLVALRSPRFSVAEMFGVTLVVLSLALVILSQAVGS